MTGIFPSPHKLAQPTFLLPLQPLELEGFDFALLLLFDCGSTLSQKILGLPHFQTAFVTGSILQPRAAEDCLQSNLLSVLLGEPWNETEGSIAPTPSKTYGRQIEQPTHALTPSPLFELRALLASTGQGHEPYEAIVLF